MNALVSTNLEKAVTRPPCDPELDLSALPLGSGVLVKENVTAPPAVDGLIARKRLRLPEFRKVCYYAPFQDYAIDPALDLWPEGYNQCHPLLLEDIGTAKRGGFFAILELADGSYVSILPMVTATSMAWLRGSGKELLIEAGHWGTGSWQGDLGILAWARDANLYRSCESVWRAALEHPLARGLARMRSKKCYPAPLRYLGWCSWEELKWDIGEKVLVDTIQEIDASPVPVRWILIDDGHIDEGEASNARSESSQNGEVPIHESERRLFSLGVNRRRFPNGWEPVFKAREGTKIRWMGLWLNFNGYWGGIHSQNALGAINDSLIEAGQGTLQPGPSEDSAAAFYDELVGRQKEEGFDFVKVDNQAKNVTFYRGHTPNAVSATIFNHRALENAADRNLSAMINCMAHNNLCAFSSRHSQITRCSEDYKKGDLWRAKHHLSNSFANMLWLGQTVWGDHDMFHSSDEVAGEVMARSKAISGGPIYLSDRPDRIRLDLVRQLCFEDGRLLQPLAPAAPLPESVFLNSYEDDSAYRVIAPLSHGCVAIAAYNLTHPEKPVHGKVSMEDYRWASAMMQDDATDWEIPGDGLIAFDVKRRNVHILDKGAQEFVIPAFGDEFFLLCPLRNGIAVIGREDKILSPQGIDRISRENDQTTLFVDEQGPLIVWSLRKPIPATDEFDVEYLGGGLWRIPMPVAADPRRIALLSTL